MGELGMTYESLLTTIVMLATLAYDWPTLLPYPKEFSEIGRLPAPAVLVLFRAAPISAGESKTGSCAYL